MKQMMVDLETLGTGPRAAVIQLGIAVFTMENGPAETLQLNVDLDSSIALGGVVDRGAFTFWMRQPEEARASVTLGGVEITYALHTLSAMYSHCERIWSHGSVFDVTILEGYYRAAGLRVPWSYGAVRDTRTLYEVAEWLGYERPKVVTTHTALADAVQQVDDVRGAWNWIQACHRPEPVPSSHRDQVM